MKKSTVWMASLAMSMAMGVSASAQGWGPGHERGPQGREFDQRRGPPDRHFDDRRGPGAGPGHNFHRGDRLGYEYRSRTYVVDDWRGHRLSAPPRGYHWVQTGADYVLVAIATGIIAQVLLGN